MGRQRITFAVACVWSSVLTIGLGAVPSDPPARVQIAQGLEQRWALTATEGAAQCLRDPHCQQVLPDSPTPAA